jgi:cytochrome c556
MSDVSTPGAPATGPKKSKLTSIVLLIVAVIALISGITKMKHGLSEMSGSELSAEIKVLMDASNNAVREANTHIQAAAPKFQTLLNALDASPLEQVRSQQSTDANEVAKDFKAASEQFVLAASKLDEALKFKTDDVHKNYFTLKSHEYRSRGNVFDKNAQIVGLVLDASIVDHDALVAKILEIAKARDVEQKSADDDAAEAEKLANDAKK